MNWRVRRLSDVTAQIDITYVDNSDWEQWVLVTSDRHFDNPASDRALQRKHLDQAREVGAIVIDLGDFFDAMQGKLDKRASKKALLAEFAARSEDGEPGAYLNQLVKSATRFIWPYRDLFALIGEGNHESAIEDKLEVNLLDSMVDMLEAGGSGHVIRGGFRGWIRFQFDKGTGGGTRTSRVAYYHHGYGGGGQVTKDVIQANRKAVYLDADYVLSGHTHDEWHFPIEKVALLQSGREVHKTQHHLKIPSYKDEFFNYRGGFHHQRGGPPKPVGAWWIRFYYSPRMKTIHQQFIQAEK